MEGNESHLLWIVCRSLCGSVHTFVCFIVGRPRIKKRTLILLSESEHKDSNQQEMRMKVENQCFSFKECSRINEGLLFVTVEQVMSDTTHPDIFGVFSLCYPHHPQKLVNIISRVANHTPKDDQDIIHIQWPHYVVGCTLVGRHGFPHLEAGQR